MSDTTLDERTNLTPEEVTMLLEVCLKTTYFVYQHKYYEQTDSAAMGSPVSPVVANIFMEHVEEEALRTSPHGVRCWKRYVDDTFCFLRRATVDPVLNHLNSLYPSIQFTVEQESGGKIPFLDALVSRQEDGSLEVSVYRKITHTDRYLSFKSHHPVHVKRGVVQCLLRRAQDVTTSDELLQEEIHHVNQSLQRNSYPAGFLRSSGARLKQNRECEEEEPLATAVLPYYQDTSEKIRRILKQNRIRATFQTTSTLGHLLTKVKDPVPQEERSGVVYRIDCECGDYYIGEHKADCKHARFERSAVAEHAWQDGHSIDWENVQVVDVAEDTQKRLVKEAVHISSTETDEQR